MKLLNFCIGKVQTIQIGNESVRTAHVKAPVAEPWIITSEGAAGDERAVHPDKIYAYARNGYQHWGSHFQVDPALWPDGFFGENLTFDVLDEDELRIGDVFQLGPQVRLVVAGPRNPCLKLSWRLGQPPTFQKVFQQSHHTGVYFGVLQTGQVRPGDLTQLIERDESMPNLSEVAHFAGGHTTPPLGPLKRVLDFPHLSKTIRHILHAKLDASERAVASTEGRWRGWRDFTIERIVEEAPGIRSFYLRADDGSRLCQPRAGQFVTVQMSNADGELITRCWSLSSHTYAMEHYRLTVRRQDGAGSNWLHRACTGSKVRLRPPAGEFVLDTGSFRPVVLIAAGIGVTPLLAMIHAHLARGETGAPIYLIYGARSPAHVAFRDELDALAAAHPSLHITYVYSASDAGGRPAGRITLDLVMSVLADLHIMLGERRIPLPWFENDTYICGPGDFCAELERQLVARGANADHIFYELFSAAPVQSTEIESAEVHFCRSGLTCTWRAEEDLTLLELAEREGVTVANECRAGACLTCRTKILEGVVTAVMDDGHALLCIGRPRTAVVALEC
jgi:ferredoxin-NADP reductase/MOSC domain-containing protein YiiM